MPLRISFVFLFACCILRLSAQNCSSPPSALQNGDFPATGTGNIGSTPDVTIPFWWASHGTPTVRNDNAPGGSGRGIWMWSYSGGGEGIYSCYKFIQGKTYRVRLWFKNTNAINLGKLRILASGPFSGAGIPNPASYQIIDESHQFAASWTQIDVAFTAQNDFNRLVIYPYMATGPVGGKQYELVVDKVEIITSGSNFGNLNLSSSANIVCEGEKVHLGVDMTLWDPNYIVSWYENTGSGPQLKESGTSKKLSFTARTTTTWTIRVIDPSDPSGNTFIEKDISITVLPAIELEHSGDTTICHGDTAVLVADGQSCKHAQDHLRFTWTNAQNGAILQYGKILKVSPQSRTVYQIHLQDTLTGFSRTGLITVYVDSRFEIKERRDTLVCRGSTVRLFADVEQCKDNPVYYNWRNTAGGSELYGQAVDVRVDEPATYLVTAINSHGLMDTALVEIGILAGPTTELKGADSLCLGDTLKLRLVAQGGTGQYRVTWFLPNGLLADSGFQVALPNGINGFYKVKTEDGCAMPILDSVEIAFFPIPGAILETTFEAGCAPIQFKAWDKSYRHEPDKNEWLINNLHLADSGDLDFTFRLPGQYVLSLVVNSGKNCRDTFKFPDTLNVYPSPVAQFDLSASIEELLIPVQVFNQAHGADSLVWDFARGNWRYFMGSDTSVLMKDTGKYKLTQIAYNSHGCVDSTFRILHVIPPFQYFVPNAFSPNLDEYNAVFKPHIEGVKTYTMTIYNRWGGLVYTGVDGAWDGTYKGKAMADDVYMYVIQFTAFKGQRQTIKGNVTLIR